MELDSNTLIRFLKDEKYSPCPFRIINRNNSKGCKLGKAEICKRSEHSSTPLTVTQRGYFCEQKKIYFNERLIKKFKEFIRLATELGYEPAEIIEKSNFVLFHFGVKGGKSSLDNDKLKICIRLAKEIRDELENIVMNQL